MLKQDEYLHLRHNKTLLFVHLIFVTKYREPLLAKGIWERIRHEMYSACTAKGLRVMEMEPDRDHIHILLQYPPGESVSGIVRYLKQVTTYRAWQAYGRYLKTVYWHEKTLWSDGYFAASIGNASRETIEQYIRNQG